MIFVRRAEFLINSNKHFTPIFKKSNRKSTYLPSKFNNCTTSHLVKTYLTEVNHPDQWCSDSSLQQRALLDGAQNTRKGIDNDNRVRELFYDQCTFDILSSEILQEGFESLKSDKNPVLLNTDFLTGGIQKLIYQQFRLTRRKYSKVFRKELFCPFSFKMQVYKVYL